MLLAAATQPEALVKGMTKNRLNLNDARPFGKIGPDAARRSKDPPKADSGRPAHFLRGRHSPDAPQRPAIIRRSAGLC
jgi:hypothetical protein